MTTLTHCKTGEQVDMPELIDLQNANVSNTTKDGIKSDWKVRKNITGDTLFTMPNRLNDTEAFGILKAAREFELIAFNEGINFQKTNQNKFLIAQIEELKLHTHELTKENSRLANVLDNITKGN